MKNKPNMYRVTYLVMEGNNYAGGLVKHQKDIESLADVSKFNRVESVVEIFTEVGEIVNNERIQKSIYKAKKLKEKEDAENKVNALKCRLHAEEVRLRNL